MQSCWLNKKDENKKIIVFFCGWGMDETCVSHLICDDFDIFVLYDYRNCEFDFSLIDFQKYDEKYLIAWSMGGYIANLFEEIFNNFDKKITINSTNKIIDDDFGIPKRVYAVTVRLFSEESKDKFVLNMFNTNRKYEINRNLIELKEELIAIQNVNFSNEIKYDEAIISKKDFVVPTKNQIKFWENKTKIRLLEASHYPFDIFSKWSEIIC